MDIVSTTIARRWIEVSRIKVKAKNHGLHGGNSMHVKGSVSHDKCKERRRKLPQCQGPYKKCD